MQAKKPSRPSSAKNHAEGSKSQLEQSTTILQSHSSALKFPCKGQLQSHSHSKFHGCCNSTHSQQLHFRPEVHTLPFQIYPQQHALARSKKEQWEALTENGRVRTQLRTQAKLKEEESRLKECTFHPRVSQFSLPPSQQPVHDKLYQQAEQRRREQLQQEELRIERERKEVAELQGARPDAERWRILNSEKFDLEPLYMRLGKVIEEKKRSRKMAAEREEANCSFQPQISEASKKMAKKCMVENVVDRLLEDYRRKEECMTALRENAEASLRKQLTFTPNINNYIPDSHFGHSHPSCHQQPQYSFVPTINTISSIMMQQRQGQTEEQRIHRLCNASLLTKQDNLARIEAEAYAECHFNPEINQISRQMNISGHKHHLCEAPQSPSPTHQPAINQASRQMSSSRRAQSQDNTRKKQQQKQASYKQQSQYLQMKECSFHPSVRDNRAERQAVRSQAGLQKVAGFREFCAKVERARRQEQERKQAEARPFELVRSYDLRMQRRALI